MLKWAKQFITLYLGMNYRLNRQRFVKGLAIVLVIGLLDSTLAIIGEGINNSSAVNLNESLGMFNYIHPVVALLPLLLSIGRLYDLGKGKKYLLLYAVPGINVLFLLYLLTAKGSKGDNSYGCPVTELTDEAVLATTSYNDKSAFFSCQGSCGRNEFFWKFSSLNLISYTVIMVICCIIIFSGISGLPNSLDYLVGLSEAEVEQLVGQLVFDYDVIAVATLWFAGLLFCLNGILQLGCISLSIKRWHDIGRSGWFVLYTRLPAYIWGLVYSINDSSLCLYYDLALFLFLIFKAGKSKGNEAL